MIKSPIYSFVDFEDRLSGCILLSYKAQFGFQFYFAAGTEDIAAGGISVWIADIENNILFQLTDATVSDECAWGEVTDIDEEDFPVIVGDNQIIPAGTYDTIYDFWDILQSVGINANNTTFLQCCQDNLQNYTISYTTFANAAKTININFSRGIVYVDATATNQESDFESHGIAEGNCYKLAIKKTGGETSDIATNYTGNTSATSWVFTLKGDVILPGAIVQVDFTDDHQDGIQDYSVTSTVVDGWDLDDLITDLYNKIFAINPNALTYTDDDGFDGVKVRGATTASGTVTITNVEGGADYTFSNVFKRTTDKTYLTFLTYYNNEDAFDFHYGDGSLVNKMWLPIIFRNPKPITTRKIYRRSNKTYKVQFANIEKELDAKTDYLPEAIHDRIDVALEHDNKHAFSDGRFIIDDDIFMNSEYNIDWPDNDLEGTPLEAMATFKVLKFFAGRNSNCEQRAVCIALPSPVACEAVTFSLDALPAATVGQPWYVLRPLDGDSPFVLTINSKPDWMNISISDHNLVFSGVPPESGSFDVDITVSNCNGDHSVNYTSSVTASSGGGEGLTLLVYMEGTKVGCCVSGGTPPYHVSFTYSYTGSCGSVTFTDPYQTVTEENGCVETDFSWVAYSGTVYSIIMTASEFGVGGATGTESLTVGPCLVPETEILMPDNSLKLIKDLNPGERLYDSTVKTFNRLVVDRIYNINNGLLKCSKDHVHPTDKGLTTSAFLQPGFKLYDKDGQPVIIETIEITEGSFEVISISTDTEYYIANGIVTHNKIPC
jgi:hypothetical protein